MLIQTNLFLTVLSYTAATEFTYLVRCFVAATGYDWDTSKQRQRFVGRSEERRYLVATSRTLVALASLSGNKHVVGRTGSERVCHLSGAANVTARPDVWQLVDVWTVILPMFYKL